MPADTALIVALGIAGLVCVVGPIGAAWAWHRRSGEPYRVFGYGAAVFALSEIVLRLPWQLPLAAALRDQPRWAIPFWAFSGLTAGVFEEVGRYVGYRTWLKGRERPETAVMYGLGAGGLESMLLVGVQLLGVAIALTLLALGLLHDAQIGAKLHTAAGSDPFGTASAAIVERVAAITLHVGLALVVQQAVVRRDLRWLGAAIAIHAVVDFGAVFLARGAHWPIAAVECAVVLASAATLYLALRLMRSGR